MRLNDLTRLEPKPCGTHRPMRRLLGILATGSTAFGILLACRSIAHAETPPESNCYGDDDCPDPEAPYCDPVSNHCRPCLVDDHCGADHVCHQHQCIPKCFANTDCGAPEYHCSPEGICLECLEDAHCSADEPLCLREPGVGECVGCIVDEDCSGGTPLCGWFNTCVGCLDHADCPEDQNCSQGQYACVADVCEPGASHCSDDRKQVIQCNEFGSGQHTVEWCIDADCEDGACGGSAGTEAGTSEGQEDTAEETGDPGVDSPGGRGCSCNVESDEPPLAGMGLALLGLFGWRSRRRS